MTARYCWLFAALALVFPRPALADQESPPYSYKEFAPGGKFVFVMTFPGPVEDEVRWWDEESAARMRYLRRVYAKSGMYHNDGSAEPLWTVDWYAYGVVSSADGMQ